MRRPTGVEVAFLCTIIWEIKQRYLSRVVAPCQTLESSQSIRYKIVTGVALRLREHDIICLGGGINTWKQSN